MEAKCCYQTLVALVPGQGEADLESLCRLMPALNELKETSQDPRHHAEGDVLTHTGLCLQALNRDDVWHALDDESRFVLFYATLLHDLGKALSTQVEPDGSITSRGHSRRGAVQARELLWRAQVPFQLRERICRLILTHQVPGHLLKRDDADFQLRKLSWETRISDLLILARADALGRLPLATRDTMDEIELVGEMAREQDCLDHPFRFPDEQTRYDYFHSEGHTSHLAPCRRSDGSKVLLLSGMPASGKDTWARKVHPELPVVSYDAARLELGLKHGDNDGAATQLVLNRAKEYLRSKSPFIWNATHISREMRQKAMTLLENYRAHITVVYLEECAETLAARDRQRDSGIPEQFLAKLRRKWEIPLEIEAHQVRYLIQGHQHTV